MGFTPELRVVQGIHRPRKNLRRPQFVFAGLVLEFRRHRKDTGVTSQSLVVRGSNEMEEELSRVPATKGPLSNAGTRSWGPCQCIIVMRQRLLTPSLGASRPSGPCCESGRTLSSQERAAWGRDVKPREICAGREVRWCPRMPAQSCWFPGCFMLPRLAGQCV